MRIVLTNDDGFDAPGLAALEAAARDFGETIVVAPDRQHSGASHQVTAHAPIELRRVAENRYELSGTPVDCARVALVHLATDADLVLSGINAGANIGADAFISGTVAAAREAVLLGCPAIAVSQYLRMSIPVNWSRAVDWTREVLRHLLHGSSGALGVEGSPSLWNVNFPCLAEDAQRPDLVHCELDVSPHAVAFRPWTPSDDVGGDVSAQTEKTEPPRDRAPIRAVNDDATTRLIYSGVYDQRPRRPGRDVDVCFSGSIAISRLTL